LKDAAEKAKCELSTVPQTSISLPFIGTSDKGPLHLELILTREKLEELTADLIERTIGICEKTLDVAGLGVEEINEMILVGGQTRMPKVQEQVQAFFKKPPRKGINPDEAVAIGAAIQGYTLTATEEEKKESEELLLLDVTPLSLGIATFGGFFTKIIEKNTPIPTHASHIFTTAANNQRAVKIIVLQGESERAAENELLGEFMLSGIRPAKRGEPEVEVTFDIDSDGIVGVSAKDLDTGQQQSITVTASSGLTEQEIQWMVDRSKEYEVELKSHGDLEKTCTRLETELAKIEKVLREKKDKLPPALDKEARKFVDHARRIIGFGDLEEIKKLIAQAPAVAERLKNPAP